MRASRVGEGVGVVSPLRHSREPVAPVTSQVVPRACLSQRRRGFTTPGDSLVYSLVVQVGVTQAMLRRSIRLAGAARRPSA